MTEADWMDIARIRSRNFGMCNGGWAYDGYPDLETLDAGKTITVAEIEGPAVITQIHITQHTIRKPRRSPGMSDDDCKRLCSRGVVLEIHFDGVETPAVQSPLSDFFADGCCGRATDFSGLYVEKAPDSYNCFAPMPFGKSARVTLRNDTEFDINSYAFVEFERLPSWSPEMGYFHATWARKCSALHAGSDEHFLTIAGRGHLVGQAWSVCTDEPMFSDYRFVMEGNNEFRIDGETRPSADYLGTECAFGFCWGFPRVFSSLRHGINFVQREHPSLLSVYRFRDRNAIGFKKSLDLRINWTHEFRNNASFQKEMAERHEQGGGLIDYATTFYWYQNHIGHDHAAMPAVEDRAKTLARQNPRESSK